MPQSKVLRAVVCVGVATVGWLTAQSVDSARAVRTAGKDLQAVLDAAQPGDTILLDPATAYVGNFVLPAKEADGFITIQTAIEPARILDPSGRVSPDDADVLAKIRTPNSFPALRTAPGAHHWRLQWLEIHGSGGGDLIRLGDGGSGQNRLDSVPHDFVIDGCYIHGDRDNGQKRGVALNSGRASIVNSYFSSIGAPGLETQAIAGWNGPGPYLIENNYLEAAGVNLMFGGADPSIPNLVPSRVTIRRNNFTKRPEWRGGKWVVKNLLELKSARDVTIEWNVFEYNWLHGQAGSAVVLKSWNQEGGAPWSIVEDVTIRNNIIRHVASAFNILGRSYDHPAQIARRITIEQNLLYDVSGKNWGGHGQFLQIGDGPMDVTVDRNTVRQDGTFVQVYGSVNGQPQPVPGFRLTNNLGFHNDYGIKGDGRAIGRDTLNAYFPGSVVRGNVLAGGPPDRYPPSNQFPDTDGFLREFRDASADDYRLKTDSPLRHAGIDGGPAGADVDRLMKCIGSLRPGTATTPSAAIGPSDRVPFDEDRRGERQPQPAGCPTATAISK